MQATPRWLSQKVWIRPDRSGEMVDEVNFLKNAVILHRKLMSRQLVWAQILRRAVVRASQLWYNEEIKKKQDQNENFTNLFRVDSKFVLVLNLNERDIEFDRFTFLNLMLRAFACYANLLYPMDYLKQLRKIAQRCRRAKVVNDTESFGPIILSRKRKSVSSVKCCRLRKRWKCYRAKTIALPFSICEQLLSEVKRTLETKFT